MVRRGNNKELVFLQSETNYTENEKKLQKKILKLKSLIWKSLQI